MKHLALFIFLLLPLPALAGGAATPCTDEDTAYSEDMGYGPSASAFRWGLEIQKAVQNKDLIALFAMVDGELWHGPRKAWALKQDFDDLVKPATQNKILAEPPSCRPVGWRGYTIGRGQMWFSPNENNAHIYSMNLWVEEPAPPTTPTGWPVGNSILSPDCFLAPWASQDNLEEIAEDYEIDPIALLTTPGIFYGQEFTEQDDTPGADCQFNDCLPTSPFRNITQCQKRFTGYQIEGRRISLPITDPVSGWTHSIDYKVLAPVSVDVCQQLAPNLASQCQASYLIDWGEESGGTMGRIRTVGIYGLFDLPKGGPTTVPLKYFSSPAEALNFVLGTD